MFGSVDAGRCSYIEERLSVGCETGEVREQAQGTRSDPQGSRQSLGIYVSGNDNLG